MKDSIKINGLNYNQLTSLDTLKDELIGVEGSFDRERYEQELNVETIQELIREIRKKRNLSQEELGLKIGVKKSQISKIESGYDNISLKIISKVFVALNAKLKISVVLDDEDQLDFP
jgi:ribosome-binding protein aMBF1 (putative translation factor)